MYRFLCTVHDQLLDGRLAGYTPSRGWSLSRKSVGWYGFLFGAAGRQEIPYWLGFFG